MVCHKLGEQKNHEQKNYEKKAADFDTAAFLQGCVFL